MANARGALRKPLALCVDEQVQAGEFADAGDHIVSLIEQDRRRWVPPELTLEEVREIVRDGRASGRFGRSVQDVFHAAERAAVLLTCGAVHS
jgi:Arc/MetJ-type ribon-helix-helix transcriptional regulator